jgi:hypothetical protein
LILIKFLEVYITCSPTNVCGKYNQTHGYV